MPAKRPLEERFWEKVVVGERSYNGSPCLQWTAYRCQGYGRIAVGRRSALAHRVAWEMQFGEISQLLVVDHLCRNRGCVNVAHMELVTQKENTVRGEGGKATASRQRAKTHCPQGHPYSKENTILHGPKGDWRRCRECAAAGQRRRRKGMNPDRAGEIEETGIQAMVLAAG